MHPILATMSVMREWKKRENFKEVTPLLKLIKKTKKEGKEGKEEKEKMKSSICITSSDITSSDASSRVRTFATNWSSFTIVYSHKDKDNDVYTKYDFSESISVYDIVDKFANELCSFCLFEEGTYNMWTATFGGSGIIVHHHMKDGDSIVFANSLIEYV